MAVCDNLASNKIAAVKKLVESVEAKIRYFPAYSTDLNHIEMASKLKNLMKKKAARIFEALQEATAEALKTFTPSIY